MRSARLRYEQTRHPLTGVYWYHEAAVADLLNRVLLLLSEAILFVCWILQANGGLSNARLRTGTFLDHGGRVNGTAARYCR